MDANPDPAFFSAPGVNVATTTYTGTGRFIQYRTTFTTSAPNIRSATPVLRGPVAIRYVIEGHPSLFVDPTSNFPQITSGAIVAPNIKIVNGLPPAPTHVEKLLDADIEGPGTFFVDLYTFPPNVTGTKPVPNALGQYPLNSVAFAEIGKQTMIVDKNYLIPASAWKKTCPTAPNCPPANWKVLFNQTGLWTAYVVVDSMNYVTESDTPNTLWEADNVLQIMVDSKITGRSVFLPVTYKALPTP
jgi:hypothetical protein